MAKLLGREQAALLLRRPLLNLLRDSSFAVKSALLPILSMTLSIVLGAAAGEVESLQRAAMLGEVAASLQDLEGVCGRKWRAQLSLLSSFTSFVTVFTPEQVGVCGGGPWGLLSQLG